MRPPSKKEIKASIEKLKAGNPGADKAPVEDAKPMKLTEKKSSQRIRKKGI